MTEASGTAPSITLNRRKLMGLGAGVVATVVGMGAISRSVAHDDRSGSRATPQASPASSPIAEAASFEIATVDLAFEPKTLTIPANTNITVVVTNNGNLPHDMVIGQLGLSTGRIGAGETRKLKVHAAPGVYQFYCSIPGHKQAGMIGSLTVE